MFFGSLIGIGTALLDGMMGGNKPKTKIIEPSNDNNEESSFKDKDQLRPRIDIWE